ncbi:MAG: LPS-assembly protein LptD precursor, partial [Pseudomonadota bacterium]
MKTTHTFQKQKLAQALTLCGVLLWQLSALAQEKAPTANPPAPSLGTGLGTGLVLKNSIRLEEKISDAERKQSPVFVSGERISARPDLDLVIDGDASLRKQG